MRMCPLHDFEVKEKWKKKVNSIQEGEKPG